MFQRLKSEGGISFLFITHDFGIVRHLADKVYVMKNGVIVESGTVTAVLDRPQKSYTQELIQATG